jgi:hypothetical protein
MKDKKEELREKLFDILARADSSGMDKTGFIDELFILISQILKTRTQELAKKVEGMKRKTGFTPGELCFNIDKQEKEYQVYIYNQAIDDFIKLLKEE